MKEWVRELEDTVMEIIKWDRKEKKINEDNLRDLWDSIKHINISILWILEGEERKRQRTYMKK